MKYFVDTNLLIQCKDLKEINWSLITEDKNIELIICRIIQKEIDSFKNKGSDRRSQKARKISSLFKQIILNGHEYIIQTKDKYHITITLLPSINLQGLNIDLDLSIPDNELIATLLKFIQEFHPAVLLTHDVNPILTAKSLDLPYTVIPDDWILPPQNDQKDKEILKLKAEIAKLQFLEPKLECTFSINDHDTGTLKLKTYKKITFEQKEHILEKIKIKKPIKMNFEDQEESKDSVSKSLINEINKIRSLTSIYVSPSEDDIQRYLTQEYPNWINNLGEKIDIFHDKLNEENRLINFSFSVKNVGNIPLEDFNIIFQVFNGAFFLNPSLEIRDEDNNDFFPPAPFPPQGKWQNRQEFKIPKLYSSFAEINTSTKVHNSPLIDSHLRSLSKNIVKKKDRFYWVDGKPDENTDKFKFHCQLFPHKIKTENFNYSVILPRSIDIKKLVIQIDLYGSNLKDPVKITKVFDINYVQTQMDEDLILDYI